MPNIILEVAESQPIELIVADSDSIEMSVSEQIVIGGASNLQSKSVSYTPTESAQSGTVQPDVGYDGLSSVSVSVGAIDDEYVGSAVPRRTAYDLVVSGDQITTPAGYYETQVAQRVATGSAGTPTATKGAVSNHAIAVTPSVTNTEGYINGGTKTGTAVSVAASELVSGTKSITANGTGIDVTEYQKVDVAVPSGSPTLQNKTVYPSASDQSITADNGYDGLGTVSAKAVVLSNLIAANIKSGVTVEVGDVDDADRVASVTGTYSGGGDVPLIPTTYQRVEYIEGTGSGAVIDTGFVPDENTSAIVKFTPLVTTGDCLFGTMGVLSSDRDKWRIFNYSSSFYFDCGRGNSSGRMQVVNWLSVNTQRYVSIGNKWIIDMTAGLEMTGASSRTFDDPITTNIFINGGSATKSANSKWYDVKIFDGGTLARDFVPCYRKSDSVVGLYDRVTEAFFMNSGGGGSFTAGPDVVTASDLIIILLGGA